MLSPSHTPADTGMLRGGERSPSAGPLSLTMPAGWLIAALVAWLSLDQLLLWRFLDVMPLWAYALGGLMVGGLCAGIVLSMRGVQGPSAGALLLCLGLALLLLVLGGEGRLFYANVDWQVRYAVMRDISVQPWPFVYTARGAPDVLRAPIGMFLLPGAAAKAWGLRAADIALLLQNSLMLTALLGLGSTLFETRRAKLVALAIVIGFSGLDALGRILFRGGLSDHIENWAYLQYSSTITLAFWVPQHAMAGWIGALGYLLWRSGKMPIGAWLALLPLTALWSPLGLMGAMPFAALAGVRVIVTRAMRLPDIALPAAATLLSIPGLLYLGAAPEAVGARFKPLLPLQWGAFELLEVLVYVVPVAFVARRGRFGRDTLALLTTWLLLIPFVQVGWSTDFMMRGSVTALTILAVMVADSVLREQRLRLFLFSVLLIGSVTGIQEARRALSHPPAPQVQCSFFKAWDQSFWFTPKGSYLAPLAEMPALVRPQNPYRANAKEPARCWDGHWYHPNEIVT